jgi:predicted phage terminase large subunit-like protein
MTFTRWHEDDLAGRILADEGLVENGGKWVVLNLPALKEHNENPDDDFREIGDPLWPEMVSLKTLLKFQESGSRTWTSVYQQRPAPKEGGLIKRAFFPIWTSGQVMDFIKGRDFVRHFVVDTAFTNKSKNDPSAIMEFFIMENFLIILSFKKFHLQIGELLEELKKSYAKGTRKSRMYIEPKANGISIVQLLQRVRMANGDLINVQEDFNPDVDKYARAASIIDLLETGRVILVSAWWNEVFLTDCAVFPNGKEKEAVDTLVQAVDKLQNPGMSSSSMRIGLPNGGN